MRHASVDQSLIDQALREAMPLLPTSPRIVRLEGEEYVDTTGDPSLKIRVTYAAETTDEEILASRSYRIKEAIRESMVKHGLRDFAYFNFAREGELPAE